MMTTLLAPFGRVHAQTSDFWDGSPTYRDDYMNFLISGGYQMLFHNGDQYHTGTIHAEAVYSFFGSRAGLTLGPDYISFSPAGLIMFIPAIFMRTLNESGGGTAAGILLALAFSAAQWHIRCSDHIEVNLGWDALKVVRMRNYDSSMYIAGSLNAALTGYFGDYLYLSAYYEFNHNHNPLIKFINWSARGTVLNEQPSFLTGHSFGVRVGVQL